MTYGLDMVEAILYGLGAASLLFGIVGFSSKAKRDDHPLVFVACVFCGIGVALIVAAIFLHSP